MPTSRASRFGAAVSLAALTLMIAPSEAISARTNPARTARPGARLPFYKDAAQPIARRVDDLLARMTLDEKVAQMMAVWEHKDLVQDTVGNFSAAKASASFPNGIGQIARPSDRRGVAADTNGAAGASGSHGRGPRETADYTNAAQHWAVDQTRLGIPIIMHEESLHGYVARDATSFPQSIGLASTWDPALLTRVFTVAAREMRARGATLALAPVVDVARDPRWGRIEETYGEDPTLVSEMGLAAMRGFQGATLPLASDKVFVTLKHMTGHGQPANGTNTGPAELGERELRTDFFPPFQKAVTNLPIRAVMPSYNEIDGVPSHINKWLLTDVLRKEWGYQGSVVSDYFAIRELVVRHKLFGTLAGAAAAALDAGVDTETPDGEAYKLLPELVRTGKVPIAEVDAAVRRILRMKFESGLFEHPYVDASLAEARTATPDAVALARQAAREAIVLLKNDRQMLPLDPNRIGHMLVVGTHARDTPIGGYSDEPKHVVSVLEGLQSAAQGRFSVDYSEGVRITESRSWTGDEVKLVDPAVNVRLIADAVTAARKADVIVMVLGDNEQTSREAWADNHLGDRSSLDLIGQQNDLAAAMLALSKPVVVLLLNGRPLSVNMLAEKAPALVEGWYLGQETGNAVADVLLGKVNPGGKLPVSIARSVGQLPIFYNRKPSARRGYLFDTTAPLYPFGYGLSYTSFSIGAPRLDRATIGKGERARVSIDVANTGARAGDEVVQLYVRDDYSSVTRPIIELKHFQRVALAPGERRTVTFELTPDDLALWNAQMKHVVEPGTFTISAGPNSVELKSATLTVTG